MPKFVDFKLAKFFKWSLLSLKFYWYSFKTICILQHWRSNGMGNEIHERDFTLDPCGGKTVVDAPLSLNIPGALNLYLKSITENCFPWAGIEPALPWTIESECRRISPLCYGNLNYPDLLCANISPSFESS